MSIGSKKVGPRGLAIAGVVVMGMLFIAAGSKNSSAPPPTINSDHRVMAQVLITQAGYRCGDVNAMVRLTFKSGFRVTCDGSRYAYALEDSGGRWVVRAE